MQSSVKPLVPDRRRLFYRNQKVVMRQLKNPLASQLHLWSCRNAASPRWCEIIVDKIPQCCLRSCNIHKVTSSISTNQAAESGQVHSSANSGQKDYRIIGLP